MDKDLKKSTTGDTSPLTTSTESETFDTWTVISDKTKDEIQFTPLTPDKSDDDDEIAVDDIRVEVLKASDDLIENRYNDIDDLSDGISIISESESAGRMSPHPELRKRLSELNMRFITSPPMPMPTTSRSYEDFSETSAAALHRMETLSENDRRPRRASSGQLIESTDLQATPRYGLRGLFYVGALLAVLAFISKVKYDAWESIHGTKINVMQDKISDLELKNNLMRAEVDILAKQVNYLTSLSENKKYTTPSAASNKPKKTLQQGEKKMKVWPGNGNIEEIEISAKDLKKPFKCEGHNNVDIGGMCIELPLSGESVVDSIGEKVRVVIDENEYLSSFEKVVDRMAQMAENPFAEQIETPTVGANIVPDQPKADFIPHEHKPDKYDSKKHEKRDNYKKHSTKYDSGESKERSPRRDKSNEEHDDSGERHKKSKEYKKYDKRSSMEYENARREADGQWHEKMMQNRENSRKNSEKHRHDNNWYIERGDSREQARTTDFKHRGSGQR